MNVPLVASIIGAICAWLLVAGALVYRPRSMQQWYLLAGLGLLSLEALLQALSFGANSRPEMLTWQRASAVSVAFLPGVWLAFGLTFARGNPTRYLKQWLPALILIGVAVPLLISIKWESVILGVIPLDGNHSWVFPVAFSGKLLHATIIVAAVLVVTNLEWTFRAAVGTSRWKVKYAFIGLALLCGARVYSSSQVLLYSAGSPQHSILNATALALACLFLGIAMYRTKLAQIDIYPSPTVLHRSFTVLLAGGYLVIVGLLAKVVSAIGGNSRFPLEALFILVALGGFAVLFLSDQVRQFNKQFVQRHFKRPTYDYRDVWSTLTRRTATVLERQEYSRVVARFISETFEALSVTIWLADHGTSQLLFASSTSLEPGDAAATPVSPEVYEALCTSLDDSSQPVDIDRSAERWCEMLRMSNPACFPQKGGHRFCIPLASAGELVGLVVLGDRVGGRVFSPEDLELLKCLCDQLAAGLRNLQLSEKLIQAREMEAFQAMSAFLVHDLKNTASALSLTLRNLPVLFDNPAFRQDALRTLSRSVERVNDLIGRLTMLRHKMELHRATADLNEVLTAALQVVGEQTGISLVQHRQPLPMLQLDVRQIESAVVNLVMNAREASPQGGTIIIETSRQNGGAILAVRDNGCGMTPEFVSRSLFKPFKTSKKNGLGIGMFQTKTIIEAHGGRITVQSEPGKGSTFRIWLPGGGNVAA